MAAKYKLMKTLSAIEVEEKMEMGLCFLCDEPLTLDHYQLKHKNIKIVMRDIDEDEVESEPEDLQQHVCGLEVNKTEVALPEDNEQEVHDVADVSQQSSVSTPIPTHSTSFFFEPLRLGDEDTAKSHEEDKFTADSTSKIQTEIERKQSFPFNLQHLSEVKSQSLSPNTVCVSTIFGHLSFRRLRCFDPGGSMPLSSLARCSVSNLLHPPPPEPPDIVTFMSLNLSLLVATIGISPAQYLDRYSFTVLHIAHQLFDEIPKCHVAVNNSVLQTACQLFDEMPKYHIAVWNVVSSRYKNNEMENVTFDLSKGLNLICIAPGHYIIFNILLLCSLEFLKFGMHDHFVGNSPVIISLLMNGKCAQRDLHKNLLEKESCLFINIISISCFWYEHFLDWGMRKLFGKTACSHFDGEGIFTSSVQMEAQSFSFSLFLIMDAWSLSSPLVRIYNIIHYHACMFQAFSFVHLVILPSNLLLTTIMTMVLRPIVVLLPNFCDFLVMEGINANTLFSNFTEKEWIVFAYSSVLAFKPWSLLPMIRKFTYEEDNFITQIYSKIKEISITVEDWLKVSEDITLSYLFMMNYHCQFYNLNVINKFGGDLVVWLKNLVFYPLTRWELNLKYVLQDLAKGFISMVNFAIAKCAAMNNVLKVISILIHEVVLELASEVYFAAYSRKGICYELLTLALLNSLRWPNCGALVLSVTVVVFDKEAYHNHPWFLWKMHKFIHYVHWYVCVKASLFNDAPLFDIKEGNSTFPTIQRFLLAEKRIRYMAVLHRKMIYKDDVQAAKVMIKWKNWFPKHEIWKFVAHTYNIVAIFHRKMINRGNVRDSQVLIKWKALPLKHDTCDCSSLWTRMFEGEGIVIGIKY